MAGPLFRPALSSRFNYSFQEKAKAVIATNRRAREIASHNEQFCARRLFTSKKNRPERFLSGRLIVTSGVDQGMSPATNFGMTGP
ncbi:hypothetical protein, partial [Methylocystis bryophila]|uniref:hypothetical protein n=1 Tax=Methylocystis bryophila TaxID=655015 RepID=UPI003EBA29E5